MPQETLDDTPNSVRQHGLLANSVVKTVSLLLEWVDRALVLHPPSPLNSKLG